MSCRGNSDVEWGAGGLGGWHRDQNRTKQNLKCNKKTAELIRVCHRIEALELGAFQPFHQGHFSRVDVTVSQTCILQLKDGLSSRCATLLPHKHNMARVGGDGHEHNSSEMTETELK